MNYHLSGIAERAWHRHDLLIAFLAANIVYVLFAGLSIRWAIAGIAITCTWAALWPTTETGEVDGRGFRRSASGERSQGAGGQAELPLTLLSGLPDAALVLDVRGTIVSGNAPAQAIAPVPIGRPLTAWNRSPELLAAADKASRSGTQQRCNVRLFAPVERSLDVLVTPSVTRSGSEPSIVLITLRDLTDQEQLARMRADFVANASHELRTPLASLRGFIETLQGAAKDDPAAQGRFLGIMQTQAERMSRLIEDLLSLSRIEMREHVAPTASVDLAAIASDTIAGLKPLADQSGMTITTTVARGPTRATGDRDELVQVAQNLIQNAIKYGRQGGAVQVAVRHEEGQVVLEVNDDGIGIAPEHLPRLTERFYRVSAKDSKERGGTGLGLAIVKHIVNRHRGELRIASTPGNGSTFSVVLPAAPDGS